MYTLGIFNVADQIFGTW